MIMQTAERLFAERGLQGVSLREIGVAAGQRNNYAAQYHFGDRDALIKAIYEYRARELNERRLTSVAQIEAEGKADEPAVLLRALLEPHARHIGDPEWNFLGFLAQLRVARGHFAFVEMERPDYMTGFDVIVGHIRASFPHLSDDVFARRFELAFSWAISAMASYERTVSGVGPFAITVPQLLDEIVLMLVGALGAVTRARERRALRSLSTPT
jgi:AcrR family transcriptional regulator